MNEAVLKQARILIVDDEKANVRVLERILRGARWTNLKTTYDARAVPRLATTFQPDLILLDLDMPHISGLEVLEEVRCLEADADLLPIIVMTADIASEAKSAALAAGASDFLTKPVDALDVLPRVHNLLEIRFLRLQERDRNRVLEEKIWERTRAFEVCHVETLERLALAAEYRDDLTRGEHVRRVGQTSALLARALGVPEDRVEMIRLAASLHDLGKIAVPESILLKPGRLTPDEFEVMKSHTSIGAAMLSGSRHALLQMAERIARSHHERWDGGGFPQGLRGEAIPLEARIVAVADAFDAMNSDRPYRKALSSEEVWDILVDGAGRQWDLAAVDALASLVRMEVQVDRPFDVAAFLEREQMVLDPRR